MIRKNGEVLMTAGRARLTSAPASTRKACCGTHDLLFFSGTQHKVHAGVDHCARQPSCRSFQTAFPDGQDTPAEHKQSLMGFDVTRTVCRNLAFPELGARCGQPEHRAIMPMPEAAVHQDDGAVPGENQVRSTRKFAVLQTVAKPARMQSLAYEHLWLGVSPTDAAHVEPPLLGSQHISHRWHPWQRPRRSP